MKKILLLTMLLTVFSTIAMAEWTPVDGGENGVLYVDSSKIFKSNSVTTIWTLADIRENFSTVGVNHLSEKNQYEFDCKNNKYRSISSTTFSGHMGSGSIVEFYNKVGNWSPIYGYGLFDELWGLSCSRKNLVELSWSKNTVADSSLNDSQAIKANKLIQRVIERRLSTTSHDVHVVRESLSTSYRALLKDAINAYKEGREVVDTKDQQSHLKDSIDGYQSLNDHIEESRKQLSNLNRLLAIRLNMKLQADKVYIAAILQGDTYLALRDIDDFLKAEAYQFDLSLLKNDSQYAAFVKDYKDALNNAKEAIITNPRAFKP